LFRRHVQRRAEHNAGASEPDRTGATPAGGSRGIVCGAHNFAAGDLVVVALPGTTLAGGFEIAARKTYGHISDGMICAEDELGIGNDHSGIIVLPPDAGRPGDDAAALLGVGDEVLDIAVTPDLGYCLSIRGLAREARASRPVHDPVAVPTRTHVGAIPYASRRTAARCSWRPPSPTSIRHDPARLAAEPGAAGGHEVGEPRRRHLQLRDARSGQPTMPTTATSCRVRSWCAGQGRGSASSRSTVSNAPATRRTC
jgi:tRNA-binding EMAP/Myf-like protein